MNGDRITLLMQVVLLAASVGLLALVTRRFEPVGTMPQAGRLRRLGQVLLVAAWFGLMTGVLQLLVSYADRYLRGRFLFAGPAMLWMTPLACVLIFVGAGVAIGALAMLMPRLVPLGLAIGGFAWLGAMNLMLPFNQIHLAATSVLAAGLAVQVQRIIRRSPARWLSAMRRSGALVAATIILLAIVETVWPIVAERRAIARLGPARANAPSVLLLILDTVRATNMSLYGYVRPSTPELTRRAHEGTTFDMALATAPWTLKSHATMFTGRYPAEMPGDFEHPVRLPEPTLAEILRDRGYLTGGFVANLGYTSRESGLATGFIHYDDHHPTRAQILNHSWIGNLPLFHQLIGSRSLGGIVWALTHPDLRISQTSFPGATYGRKAADQITTAFLDWQASTDGRPFFAFLNYFDAHKDYRAPEDLRSRFAQDSVPAMGRYDASVAFIDRQVGRLLDELERRGALDNTIVIVTADHGEQFGAHGLTAHANSLYLQLLHVPLFIRFPGHVPAATRIGRAVTLRDIPATVLDLAGVGGALLPGLSLSANWRDSSAAPGSPLIAQTRQPARTTSGPIRFGPMQAAFDQQYHYIRRGDGSEELYAYRVDPREMHDLHAVPEEQDALKQLRSVLDQLAVH